MIRDRTPNTATSGGARSNTSFAHRSRYVLAGLMIGVFWYLNRARPPWEEALRTFAVFTVLVLVLRTRLKRRAIQVRIAPLLTGKAVLVGAAAAAQIALSGLIERPALMVAIGLGLAVALLGPLGDRRFFMSANGIGRPAPN